MVRKLVGLSLVALMGCDPEAISFLASPSCAGDFGDASDNCPPSACPFVGGWQNGSLVGSTLPCSEGASAFDTAGGVSQLTSTGWVAAGRFTTCSNRARSAVFHGLFAPRVPVDCGPACDVRAVRESDAGAGCVLYVDAPCATSLGVTVFYYPCKI